MEALHGIVEHIVYHNEENGYTVFSLMSQGKETVCVGNMAMINEGEYIRAEGDYVEHATYGRQFRIDHFSVEAPEDVFSIERYLGSGAIKGIGPTLAGRIVSKFKEDTFHIIENEPERLAEVKGISEVKAIEICRQFHEKQGMRHALMFLSKYGITTAYAVKIYNEYGSRLYDVIRENPYRLAEDITGIGFRLADEIAKKAGIGSDSDFRVRSGIIYTLLQASINGHTYLPLAELLRETAHMLEISEDQVERRLMDLSIDKKIVIKNIEDADTGEKTPAVYASIYYYLELNTARLLKGLNIRYDMDYAKAMRQIGRIEADGEMELDDMQKTAVLEAARNGVLIITGGPGTGKTTTINAIIRFFENEGMERGVLLTNRWANIRSADGNYYWYYFGDGGWMKKGWQQIGGYWYYMNTAGQMQKGWISLDGYWYYLKPDGFSGWSGPTGSMLANTNAYIDGKTYNFDASGHCTNL